MFVKLKDASKGSKWLQATFSSVSSEPLANCLHFCYFLLYSSGRQGYVVEKNMAVAIKRVQSKLWIFGMGSSFLGYNDINCTRQNSYFI